MSSFSMAFIGVACGLLPRDVDTTFRMEMEMFAFGPCRSGQVLEDLLCNESLQGYCAATGKFPQILGTERVHWPDGQWLAEPPRPESNDWRWLFICK